MAGFDDTVHRTQEEDMKPRRHVEEPKPKPIIRQESLDLQVLDLTAIARPGALTTIDVYDVYSGRRPWIKLHDISLTKHDRGGRRGSWVLDAYWADGVTDQEHDSAHILRLDLGGVELDMVHYGRVSIMGWITGQVDDFCVPPPGYAELIKAHPETVICKECRKRDKDMPHHLMVPPGFYVPPKQPELYAQMVGRRIEITIDRLGVEGEED